MSGARISLFGINLLRIGKFPHTFCFDLFGIPVVSIKPRENKVGFCVLGVPVFVKKQDRNHVYHSLFGIRIRKIYKANVKQNKNTVPVYNSDLKLDNRVCNIAITLEGGLGDKVININFIYLLRKKLGNANIRIDVYEPKDVLHSILKEKDLVDNIYSKYSACHSKYDLSINLSRFPILYNVNKKRVLFMCPKLYDMVQIWERDNIEKYKFIDFRPALDGLLNKYCLINGYKRWAQFDVGHHLGMTEKFPATLFIDIPEKEYLKSLNIPSQFITVHRGVDPKIDKNSVKQWPVAYYNELIKLIRKKYPKIFIVQLGDSQERCPEFDGVDLNLSGKTTLEEVKVLLKHSLLHIDGEGGMVHVRHALNAGKSIVLFGPTDPNVYGYSENVNLVGRACLGGCEWLRAGWQDICMFGDFIPACQYSLKPETVYEHVVKVMGM